MRRRGKGRVAKGRRREERQSKNPIPPRPITAHLALPPFPFQIENNKGQGRKKGKKEGERKGGGREKEDKRTKERTKGGGGQVSRNRFPVPPLLPRFPGPETDRRMLCNAGRGGGGRRKGRDGIQFSLFSLFFRRPLSLFFLSRLLPPPKLGKKEREGDKPIWERGQFCLGSLSFASSPPSAISSLFPSGLRCETRQRRQ